MCAKGSLLYTVSRDGRLKSFSILYFRMLSDLFSCLVSCILYPRWGIFGDKPRSSVVDSYPVVGQTDQLKENKEKNKLRWEFPLL